MFLAFPVASRAWAACDGLLPPSIAAATSKRAVTLDDLLQLREIGSLENGVLDMKVLAISPEGRRVAFHLSQANVASNTYCQGMVVLDLAPESIPKLVDRGGDLITMVVDDANGISNLPTGVPAVVTPKWSPDGNWIAYLRRDNGFTQVWRARADGSAATPVTRFDYDVADFAWSGNEQVVVKTRKAVKDQGDDLASEGKTGYLYDERFAPIAANSPFPRAPLAPNYLTISLSDGVGRNSTVAEIKLVDPDLGEPKAWNAISQKVATNGAIARAVTAKPGHFGSPLTIAVETGAGAKVPCADGVCDGVADMWWSSDGSELRFLTKEAVKPRLGLYRWKVGVSVPRRIMETEDALVGCEPSKETLVCAREGAAVPRRLVQIDLNSGQSTTLFDPNPEFRNIQLGSVQRLRWRNDVGIETFGDLVLPPDHRPGQRHPLILVGYVSRGFVRGGTGNEYPIQWFAAHGYAVLSFTRPPDVGIQKGATTAAESDRLDRVDWADRRSVLSSMSAGIDLISRMGVIDPTQVGVTGVSDGAASAQFALINSKLFAAAAISNCCEDTANVQPILGPAFGASVTQFGYPTLTEPNPDFWKPYSLTVNASTMKVPLLIQVPDDEYLYALQSYTALKERGDPVEMYVFPDEHHVKWQPEHKAAVAVRTLDWFNFWLLGKVDPDPLKKTQYDRWTSLRAELGKPASTAADH